MSINIIRRVITSLFLIILLYSGLFYNELSWKILVISFLVLCFYEFNNLIKRIYVNKIFYVISLFIIALYFYFFYFLLIKIRFEFGEEAILLLLFACIFSDIGGYIVGKLVGGPKLSSISPNKTISGAIGSIFFTLVGISLFLIFLIKIEKNVIQYEFSLRFYSWLILMSVFCQIGDLFFSFLKRKAKLKDTGNILPGHGGILDRVDGIIFAIPTGILAYFILGLNS